MIGVGIVLLALEPLVRHPVGEGCEGESELKVLGPGELLKE